VNACHGARHNKMLEGYNSERHYSRLVHTADVEYDTALNAQGDSRSSTDKKLVRKFQSPE